MNIKIEQVAGDDPGFLDALGGMLTRIAYTLQPAEIFLIRIDNWFDAKWLGFAGKAQMPLNAGLDDIDSEAVPITKGKGDVTLPPFVPNRVLAQEHLLNDSGILCSPAKPRLVHPPAKQASAKNLSNRVLDFCPEALFFWYSSKSAPNQRASLMVYHSHNGRVTGWYVSFVAEGNWQVDRVKNMDKDLMVRAFAPMEDKTRPSNAAESASPGG